MAGIELVVIIIREISAQKLEVWLADYVASRLGNQTEDAGLLMQLVGILARLVVVLETAYLQAMQPLEVFDADVEIACHIGGEVILGYLEEQLVLVDGIWTVGEQEDKPVVAVGRESFLLGGVLGSEHIAALRPDITQVELSAVESSSGIHAVYDHSRHLAQPAVGILRYHLVHLFQTFGNLALVELGHTADEEELVAVGASREPLV